MDTSNAPILGIDLGTTNSLVAVAGFGPDPRPRIIPDAAGRAMLPSVVRFNDDGSTTIGHEARESAVLHPLTTISSVKRLMGRSIRDAAADLPYLSFNIVSGPNDTARIELPAAAGRPPRTVSPQEVSAVILQRLKEQASESLGVECTRAVVTVPAYFDDAQRQATRDAGRLAGLQVVRIVNEPTAAALAYGIGLSGTPNAGPRTVIVYDLGGGTFDVSVLRLTPRDDGNEFFQVLSTAGDTHLGGDDFDHAVVALLTGELSRQFFDGAALDLPPATRQALVRFAEQARIRLSDHEEAPVRIDLGGGRVYERTLNRSELEALIAPLVERSIDCCKRALRDAARHMEGDELSAVVLVGGATRTPLVRRRVEEFFKLAPYTALNPDEVVALGAAVQAMVLAEAASGPIAGKSSRKTGRTLLLDVVPLSLGLETVGGAMAKLIMRNSTVPTRAHEMFSTSVDGQTSIKLNVLQGEREMAADCRSLGEFHLRGIPPMPAGIPKLRVEFSVDANGILGVTAVEERSGKRLAVQIVPNHGLTQEEVQRLERESFQHAREDMKRHRVADLVANARLDVHWIGRTLARVEAAEGHPDLDAASIAVIQRCLAEVKAMVEAAQADWRAVDPDAFHQAKERLDRASIPLHEVAIAMSLRGDQA